VKSEPGPPMTLGNAAVARVRLIGWRKECQHQIEPGPAEMAARYGAETPVPDWRERLVCAKCGSRQVDIVEAHHLPSFTQFIRPRTQPTPDARELLRDVMKEIIMATRFKVFALVAALATGTSSTAMAQYAVPAPGYPSNPVSGAAVGEMNGAAKRCRRGRSRWRDRWWGNWNCYRRPCRHRQCARGRPAGLRLGIYLL
jgi:hypothetical protein